MKREIIDSGNIRSERLYSLPEAPKVAILPFSIFGFVGDHVVGIEHAERRVSVCDEASPLTASNFVEIEYKADHLIGSGMHDELILRTDFQEASWVKLNPYQVEQVRSGVPNVLVNAKNKGAIIVCNMRVAGFDDPERYLACLSREDLSINWQFLQTYEGKSWFAVTEDFVFWLTREGELTKLSLASGDVVWVKSSDELIQEVFSGEPTEGGCVDNPIVYRDTIVFFRQVGQMVGLSVKDGSLHWATTMQRVSRYSGTPDGKIHVIGKDRQWTLYLVCAETGVLENEKIITGDAVQRLKKGGYSVSHQDVTQTHLIVAWVGRGESMVTAINLETGHMDWSLLDIEHGIAELIVRNNRLYFKTISATFPKAKFATYVLEGEGGFRLD